MERFCQRLLTCRRTVAVGVIALLVSPICANTAEITVVQRQPDPYGTPRPGKGQQHVPLRTSVYMLLSVTGSNETDVVRPDTVAIQLTPKGGKTFEILRNGVNFTPGYTGRLFPSEDSRTGKTLNVYVDSQRRLEPATDYTIRVTARSRDGAELAEKEGSWRFTTEAEPLLRRLNFDLSLLSPSVEWHGGFFNGFCKPSFCTSRSNAVGAYRLMAQERKRSPKAWSLQRDIWITGMELKPELWDPKLPNLVRERETRRIASIEDRGSHTLLHVEDFHGHEQYGIRSNRPLSGDYHAGDEVLIVDSDHSARAKVVGVDDGARAISVSGAAAPEGGWQIDYANADRFGLFNFGELSNDPSIWKAPGEFVFGGCYLRKYHPVGKPMYFWDRLDAEWDLCVEDFGHRLVVNFCDGLGDLGIDGQHWSNTKDYAEYHEAVRTITSHLIERYGDRCLDFQWSVFNEPDLVGSYWRFHWDEVQEFYDYTVDGILRAFEDHGYDSQRVTVGGFELGAAFGINLRLSEVLAHCSPTAEAKGALSKNAAFADRRLDGKRSMRVERLCKAHNGKGSPCDFVSVHAYNASKMMADKLARARQTALEIDPEYYKHLWVNAFESCPDWLPHPDPAYSDSYLGNGYFPTWCADVIRRQLQRAADDPRYSYGESVVTLWPGPNVNFSGVNGCARTIRVDDTGNGKADRNVTIAMPILHFLGLTNAMGDNYWVFPEQQSGWHVVSGFASKTGRQLRVLLYSHNPVDTESRSDAKFEIALTISGANTGPARVTEYRFDTEHNSYFQLARKFRDEEEAGSGREVAEIAEKVQVVITDLESGNRDAQLAALGKLDGWGPAAARLAAGPVLEVAQNADDNTVRQTAAKIIERLLAPKAYPNETVQTVQNLSELTSTGSTVVNPNANGILTVRVELAANGANYLVIEP